MLLGDRYEMLSAAFAALILNIPIFHIHGGEITTGAIDDSIRHCLTKLSAHHFVANEEFRRAASKWERILKKFILLEA